MRSNLQETCSLARFPQNIGVAEGIFSKIGGDSLENRVPGPGKNRSGLGT